MLILLADCLLATKVIKLRMLILQKFELNLSKNDNVEYSQGNNQKRCFALITECPLALI